MILEQQPVYTYIVEATKEEVRAVRPHFRFADENRFFKPAYRKGTWSGYTSFLRRDLHRNVLYFPSGLLYLLDEADIPYVVRSKKLLDFSDKVDRRILKSLRMEGKYSYQFDVVKAALREHRGIWHLATNAGKTACASAVLEVLRKPSLVLVSGLDLLEQTFEMISQETSLRVGRLGGGYEELLERDVIVSTVPSALSIENKTSGWLDTFEVVFADECHLASAETYVEVLEQCHSAYYRIGMSGTPLDLTILRNVRLKGMFGPEIAHVSNDDLIRAKVSAVPLIKMHTIYKSSSEVELPSDESGAKKWKAFYLANIVENEYRNRKIVEIAKEHLAQDHTVLVSVMYLQHGRILEELFSEEGVEVDFLKGEDSSEKRKVALDELRNRARKILILSKIGDVGLDIPSLDVLIRGSGLKSVVSTLQLAGRLLRRGGSSVVYLHDFDDQVDKYTKKHARARRRSYEREGFDVSVVWEDFDD